MEVDVNVVIAVGSAVFALASEIIGMNKKWKSNSVVQLVLLFGKRLFSKR